LGGSYRLLRIFGIDILVHWSWLGIFALLTWWLSQGFFKDVYEEWSAAERWGSAVVVVLVVASLAAGWYRGRKREVRA